MSRVYTRKFDWDVARRLRAEGLTYAAIAERFAVSIAAVYLVCKEGALERDRQRKADWQKQGRCPECGGSSSRGVKHNRCRDCFNKAQTISAREHELRCVTCREWKADEDFPRNADQIWRRGRHSQCRPCNTKERREHRQRNREADNAYQRAYRARRREAAA